MGGHEEEESGVSESVFSILNQVAGFRIGSLVGAEDFADKVNYRWSSALLTFAVFIIVIREFTFKPIQCFVPPEWPHPWEEYAENYCWVQNNYHVSYLNASFPTPIERTSVELNYYQWVPLVLAFELLLVQVPHLVWRFLSTRSGLDPNGLVRLAKRTVTLDEKRKHQLFAHLTSEIEEAMSLHAVDPNRWNESSTTRRNLLECLFSSLPCFWLGRRSGFALFFLYLVSKLAYLLVGLAHLYIMRNFLGFEELNFGWTLAADLIAGRHWRQTRVFPRVTFCDVPIKHVGQWNTRSIQCVLPLNVLNEKLYIFLWFWTVMCMTATSLSTGIWLIRIFTPKLRQQFVEKYMSKLGQLADKAKNYEEYKLRKDFISVFLSLDGLFLLSLIEHNVGNVCVTEIIFSLYGQYRARRREGRDGANGEASALRSQSGGSTSELSSSSSSVRRSSEDQKRSGEDEGPEGVNHRRGHGSAEHLE